MSDNDFTLPASLLVTDDVYPNVEIRIGNTVANTNAIRVREVWANGTNGNPNEILTSDGTYTYWAPPTAVFGVNTYDRYTWVNNHTFTMDVYFGNSTVNSTINSTTYSGTANNASYLQGNTVSDIRLYTDNKAANAYSNAIAYADTKSLTAYSNAVSYANNTFLKLSGGTLTGNLILGNVGLSVNGSTGTSGQVLTSNGSAAYWYTLPFGGTVTSVASGAGLTGGPITLTGTLSVNAQTGLVANSSGLFVNSAYISTLSPSTTGTGASGTWTINITGNSAISARTTDGVRIVNPNGGYYNGGLSNMTGAFKIKLPVAALNSSTMLRFTVKIYNYVTGASRTLEIGGYNYNGGDWYNIFATQMTQSASDINVRFGQDGTSDCVWIGETNTVWQYPVVSVTDVQVGYQAANDTTWGTGWAISLVTSFDTVEQTTVAYRPLHTGNYNSYTPTLTGTGASGTWGINITGSATNWGTYGGVPAPGTSFGNASTIGRSDASGYTYFGYINSSTSNSENPTVSQVIVTNGSDNFYRKASISHLTSAVQSSASGTWGISISGGLTGTAPNLGYAVSGQNIDYSGQGGPQILGQGSGASMISFHRPGSYAINFGLGTDNQLRTGGWSRGGNYVILDSGNYSSYALPLSGGTMSGVIYGGSGVSSLVIGQYGGATRGYLYNDTSGFGLLTSGGGWALRVDQGTANIYIPGSLGVGTTASGTGGEIRATNEITAFYSDVRLKTDIEKISNASQKLKSINGILYKNNELAKSFGFTKEDRQVGVFAQDVLSVLPEAVRHAPFDIAQDGSSKSGENYLTVKYELLVPLLIEALKEALERIEKLENK